MAVRITLGYYMGRIEPHLNRLCSKLPWEQAVHRSYRCARRRLLVSQGFRVFFHLCLSVSLVLAQVTLIVGALAAYVCALAWATPEHDTWNMLLGAVLLLLAVTGCCLLVQFQAGNVKCLKEARDEFLHLRRARLTPEDLGLLGQLMSRRFLSERG